MDMFEIGEKTQIGNVTFEHTKRNKIANLLEFHFISGVQELNSPRQLLVLVQCTEQEYMDQPDGWLRRFCNEKLEKALVVNDLALQVDDRTTLAVTGLNTLIKVW